MKGELSLYMYQQINDRSISDIAYDNLNMNKRNWLINFDQKTKSVT